MGHPVLMGGRTYSLQNIFKKDPGRAKQKSQGTPGKNFTKPCTSHFSASLPGEGVEILRMAFEYGPLVCGGGAVSMHREGCRLLRRSDYDQMVVGFMSRLSTC